MRISDWSSDVCSSDLGISLERVLAAIGLPFSVGPDRSIIFTPRDRVIIGAGFTEHASEKLDGLVAKIEPRFNAKFGHFCRCGGTDTVEAADVEFGDDFCSPPRSNYRLTVGLFLARTTFCEKRTEEGRVG